MTVTAQQTTTLPEGAVITVMKCETARRNGGKSFHTTLHAHRGDKEIEMRVDDVSPAMLELYFKLVITEITRRRMAIKQKPLIGIGKPKTMVEFVWAMAENDMFVFEAIAPEILDDTKPEKPKRKVKAKTEKKKKSGISVDEIKSVFPEATIIPPMDRPF